MARVLTSRLLSEQIHDLSAWGGFLDLVDDETISMDEAVSYMAQFFKGGFLPQVQEAKDEVRSLTAALPRLERICQAGAAAKTEAQMQVQIDAFYKELRAFDRIVVEFYETHLTMYGWIDPDQAKIKPREMANAMDAMRKRRLTEGLNLKDPKMFERA